MCRGHVASAPKNDGWAVAKYLLEFERGGGGAATRLKVELDDLKTIARVEFNGAGTALYDEPAFAARVAAIHVRVMALEFTELGTLARMAGGGSPGAAASLLKNISTEIGQDIEYARHEAIHYYGLPYPDTGLPSHADTVAARYLNGRAASIFGGAKEVQKNIIAKGVLGL